ncbi:YdiU family protein [Photobacterium japonica]|uniref:protein adenylyltransferase SelO n=1 Tax=Photobacterium japonica TaxID=2910235 RepID=UPI003D109859
MKTLSQLICHNTYRQLPTAFGTPVSPQPLDAPFLVHVNPHVCEWLELDPQQAHTSYFVDLFTGNATHPTFDPIAMKYTGHQFGQYNPDLGDGRGLLLGEVLTSTGKKWDLHLKGAGLTPYSRQGDGRAVLRSSIREYLASAAMAGLGINTTHALALLGSETPVYRETEERGATLVRVAESHVRFGHFEYLFYTQQHDELRLLADYLICHHFPHLDKQSDQDAIAGEDASSNEAINKEAMNNEAINKETSRYALLFQEIVTLTATMIADWQAIGFAHGVMNTDNMSVLGLTFDYGPYAFMDDYDPSFICNHSDYSGRYAFYQQPSIALWNLSALGYALTPLLSKAATDDALNRYEPTLQKAYSRNMRNKLGLVLALDQDTALFSALFTLLKQQSVDYTLFFYTLSQIPADALATSGDDFASLIANLAPVQAWLQDYMARVQLEPQSDTERRKLMQQHNPKFILRNYLAQQAIEKAERGDYSMIDDLLTVLQSPYDEHPSLAHLAERTPAWGKTLAISCSS